MIDLVSLNIERAEAARMNACGRYPLAHPFNVRTTPFDDGARPLRSCDVERFVDERRRTSLRGRKRFHEQQKARIERSWLVGRCGLAHDAIPPP
jgi:hypothetical protein